MEKKAKVPKLRFPGFAGDWEERKFSELYRKVNEKNDLTFGIEKTISVANMHFNKDVTITNAEYLKTYNIMRKVIPNLSLNEGIEGMGLYPIRINPSSRNYNKDILLKVCDNI